MAKTLAQKSSYRLFLWGMLLVPFATLADTVLDAILFGTGNFQEHLLAPSNHEFASRILFSTFILAVIYLGMHYLSNTALREGSLQQTCKDLGLIRQDLEEIQDDLIRQLRSTSSELTTSIELLNIRCGHDFDEKTRFLMENVCSTSNKLNEQFETSLALMEVPFGEPHRENVKLDKLALDVAEEVKNKYPVRQVEFKVQAMINGWCDRKMLRLAIYDLFCNAMEFIPQARQGRIEFGMFLRNGQRVLYVRDNGVGFSAAQAKRLFDIFRYGSRDAELPGDSIRLATVRRIIHRHGGQIWAEGVEGAGGTIFFTYYSI